MITRLHANEELNWNNLHFKANPSFMPFSTKPFNDGNVEVRREQMC